MNIPRNALKAVSLAMANRDVRFYLNGLLIQCSGRTVRLVATDGHRLHMIDLPQDVPCPPLVEGVYKAFFAGKVSQNSELYLRVVGGDKYISLCRNKAASEFRSPFSENGHVLHIRVSACQAPRSSCQVVKRRVDSSVSV